MKIKFPIKDEDALMLQFSNKLYMIGMETKDLMMEVEVEYGIGEIMHITCENIYVWQKGEKSIIAKESPINFNDTNDGKSLYESQDYLKSVFIEHDRPAGGYFFIICDELKYVKKMLLKTDDQSRKSLEMTHDYYVNADFRGETTHFCLTNQMLYQKFGAFLCQEKDQATEDLALECEPSNVGLDLELTEDVYPLKSNSWLLFYGPTENDGLEEKEFEALLLPEYNQPKVINMDVVNVGYYRAELFFFHDNNYIVYHLQHSEIDYMGFDVYRRNGEIYQQLQIRIKG